MPERITLIEDIRRELVCKVADLVRRNFAGVLRDAFDFYDVDEDGRLDQAEVKKVLQDAGVGDKMTRGMWVHGTITALDKDNDGMISWDELQAGITL